MPRFKPPAPAPPSSATPSFGSGSVKKRTSVRDKVEGLSVVAAFDDLCRMRKIFQDGGSESEAEFLKFVKIAKDWKSKWRFEAQERQRLTLLLSDKDNELTGKDYKIKQARKFVEQEQKQRMRLQEERDALAQQLQIIKDLLIQDGGKTINNETLERIRTLERNRPTFASPAQGAGGQEFLAPVEESCESLLDASDLSFDETMENSIRSNVRKLNASNRPRRSSKRSSRRSSLTTRKSADILKTAAVAAREEGQVVTMAELQEKVKRTRQSRGKTVTYEPDLELAPSTQATTPVTSVKRTFSNASSIPNRPHSFQKKKGAVLEKCHPCGSRIKFGKQVYKCRDCGVVCHIDCKTSVPLPCVSGVPKTPQSKSGNYLADYTPLKPPMIPILIEYCVKEVELRGMDDVGIYRLAGSESEANEILGKIQNCVSGKAGGPLPNLSRYEVHAVTSCIKKFLRSLKEPVIPLTLWQVFVDAANSENDDDSAMYQAISELPLPNRDTLAYLILHFQTVSQNSKVNKMSVDNLATVMAPTVVGNSSSDPAAILSEAVHQKNVMKRLLAIASDYWSTFLSVEADDLLLYRTGGHGTPVTPDQPIFATPLAGLTTGGPVARRTRSRQLTKEFSKKHQLFQSPMLF